MLSQSIELSERELEWLQQMRSSHHHFDVLRWCHAYNGDLETASKKLNRHMRIRQILRLDHIHHPNSGHEIDELVDEYAPIIFLGNTLSDDQLCPVFIEQSGQFDLGGMMERIRLTPFMMSKFKQMEQILRSIKEIEESNQRMARAILIIDLKHLKFESNLIGFISGTYRIMWGTLMEQYPSVFKKFIVVNTPSFMNLLWSACSSFIPSEYKEKIHLINHDHSLLHEHVDVFLLPPQYGGKNQIELRSPSKCEVVQISVPDNTQLETISVPAGKVIVWTYYLIQGQELQCYLRNTQEFTLNIFYSRNKKSLTNPQKEIDDLEEVYAGCERPGLPSLDAWSWRAHSTGFYHIIFGNEKAWLMSVTLQFQLFEVYANGSKIKVNPI